MRFENVFRKDIMRDIAGRSALISGVSAVQDFAPSHGFLSNSKVATEFGWRYVDALQKGDRVFTFDAGLQPVRKVTRKRIDWPECSAECVQMVHVPRGVLGNSEPLTLLPEQVVMIESDLGEQLYDDPFLLMPARALVGVKGIDTAPNPHSVEVVTLEFDTEQVIFMAGGALGFCPAHMSLSMLDMIEGHPASTYHVLTLSEARFILDAMFDEDLLDLAWMSSHPAPVQQHA